MDQPVALTIDSPPLVGRGPRLNSDSIGGMPDSPSVPFLKVEACISPQLHLAGSLPKSSSSSETPCSKDLRMISSRDSRRLVVVWSSHQLLLSSRWRMISFQREPPSG